MPELHLPWLKLAIITPLAGAFLASQVRDPERAWRRALICTALTLLIALAAWADFSTFHAFEVTDGGSFVASLIGSEILVIDEINAPLLPLTALIYFSIMLATLRTKLRRVPFAWMLLSLSIWLALLGCRQPWVIIALMAAQAVPPWLELRARGRSTRVFLFHMLLVVSLLAVGWGSIEIWGLNASYSTFAVVLLMGGVMIRSGIAPLHCWMTDLFENATFGTALLFVTPMAGAYVAVRLMLPCAPDWALLSLALLSLATALYAAGLALVQRDSRRFFCYLLLSNSSLVLAGLDTTTPISLTGGLCVWLSVGLSMAGLGLTLRALEARTGRLSLAEYHGLYEHMPSLAVFYLLTGLASIGFPGTIGFIGAELLVDGAVGVGPLFGIAVVLVGALNGIAILHAYFRLFTGTRHMASVSLYSRWPERIAILLLTALILGGGLLPQPGVASRYHAATEVLQRGHAASTEVPRPKG